jgi:dsDNA-specific endonuclease/ATPase MutS2
VTSIPTVHARRVLEYDKVLAGVAAAARTAGGRVRVEALVPSADAAFVRAEQAIVAEARRALEDGAGPWPIDAADDSRELLQEARLPGSRLEPAALGRVAATLDAAVRLRAALATQRSAGR